MPPKEIGAAKFKAQCLGIIDEVAATGEAVVVTKRGKPKVRIVPVEDGDMPYAGFGYMKGRGEIVGDIMAPIDVEWNAMK